MPLKRRDPSFQKQRFPSGRSLRGMIPHHEAFSPCPATASPSAPRCLLRASVVVPRVANYSGIPIDLAAIAARKERVLRRVVLTIFPRLKSLSTDGATPCPEEEPPNRHCQKEWQFSNPICVKAMSNPNGRTGESNKAKNHGDCFCFAKRRQRTNLIHVFLGFSSLTLSFLRLAKAP